MSPLSGLSRFRLMFIQACCRAFRAAGSEFSVVNLVYVFVLEAHLNYSSQQLVPAYVCLQVHRICPFSIFATGQASSSKTTTTS